MSDLPEIDGATALRLLREVVAERPDYVYVAPNGHLSTCKYVWQEQPSCVVAHVLIRAGYGVQDIAHLDVWGSFLFAAPHVPQIHVDEAAKVILDTAQSIQDEQFEPWSTALAAAEQKAHEIGVPA